MEFCMNLDVVFFGILGCVYSLVIALPRVRRELTAMEIGVCAFVVSLSVLVLAVNMTRDTHPRIAGGLVLVELGLVIVVICFRVLKLVAVARRRQSG